MRAGGTPLPHRNTPPLPHPADRVLSATPEPLPIDQAGGLFRERTVQADHVRAGKERVQVAPRDRVSGRGRGGRLCRRVAGQDVHAERLGKLAHAPADPPVAAMPIVLPASSQGGVLRKEKSGCRVQSPARTASPCSAT